MNKKFLLSTILASTLLASSADAVFDFKLDIDNGTGVIRFDKAGLNAVDPVVLAQDSVLQNLGFNLAEFNELKDRFNASVLNFFEFSSKVNAQGLYKVVLAVDDELLVIQEREDELIDFRYGGQTYTLNEDQAMYLFEELRLDEMFADDNDYKSINKLEVAALGAQLSKVDETISDIKSGKINVPTTALSTPAVTDAMAHQINEIGNLISNRMLLSNNTLTGQASGDAFTNFGIWIKAFGTQEKQKQTNKYVGYKGNQAGLTIGFDTEVSDQATLGLAYSYVDSKVKSNNRTSKLKSHIGTVYSGFNLSDTLFANLQASGGRSNVKLAESAKTKANMFGAKLEVGNNFDLGSSLYMVPTIGLRYDNVKTKGFKAGKRAYAATKLQRTSGDLGLMVKHVSVGDNFTMIPEAHVKVSHIFSGKPKGGEVLSVNPFGVEHPLKVPANKTPKTLYTVGGSLNFVQTKAAEFGVGYDYSFRPKFKAHSGFIKARINF